MKRLYLVLTLFMASFFFLSSKVSADEVNLNLGDNFYYITNVENFNVVKNYADTNIGDYDFYYITGASNKYVIVFINFSNSENVNFNDNGISYYIRAFSSKYCTYDLSTFSCTSYNYETLYKFEYKHNSSNFVYYRLLYSSFNLPINWTVNNISYDVNLFFDGKQFKASDLDHLPTLLEIYNYISDPNIFYIEPEDNTPILTNFYSTMINKITYFAEEFASNYIYLSIVGIFIIIFLIELIRRRFQ